MIKPVVRLISESFLSEDARKSPVWQEIHKRLHEMLEKKRMENDNPRLDHDQTLVLRGHVELLKAFLALGREPPPKVATDARPRPRIDLGAKYGQ